MYSGEGGGLSTITGEVLVFTNLPNRTDVYRVALGIFISRENLFEAHQGGEFFPLRAWMHEFNIFRSSFAEEDLMSNLIGFYGGLRLVENKWPSTWSQAYYEKLCGVVGLDLKQAGRMSEFIEKQKEIYRQYGNFQQVRTWGKPRLGAWEGSIDIDCQSVGCKNPGVPSEFLGLEPEPPFPYQSTKPTWTWVSAKSHLQSDQSEERNIPAENANLRPLNWLN
jgi:hypothetical protein